MTAKQLQHLKKAMSEDGRPYNGPSEEYPHDAVVCHAADVAAVMRDNERLLEELKNHCYDCLSKAQQNMVLISAIRDITNELSALFPVPRNPCMQDAQAVCRNDNNADAECIFKALVIAQQALQGQGGTPWGESDDHEGAQEPETR